MEGRQPSLGQYVSGAATRLKIVLASCCMSQGHLEARVFCFEAVLRSFPPGRCRQQARRLVDAHRIAIPGPQSLGSCLQEYEATRRMVPLAREISQVERKIHKTV